MRHGASLEEREERLYRLLEHYYRAGEGDREAWHDRVMDCDGDRPEDVTRWHGELLASAWIEQNTGATPAPADGRVPSCYRVTPAGRQALRRYHERGGEE